MARLIDADALLEDGIRVKYGWNEDGVLLIPLRDVTKSIKNAPTVDAVPVVHGRWENISCFDFGECYGTCSNCKTEQKVNSVTALYADYKHCRWCGAKMDGDGNG